MSEKIYQVPADWKKRTFIDDAKYRDMYARSIKDPNAFWGEAGKRIHWMKPFTKVKNTSFGPGNVSIKWFEDGTTNVAYNYIDRHLAKRRDQVAIYLPMIPEAAYAMLACARIGAIHSVVFGGFSPDSLAGRIEDCRSKVVITADEGLRGGRKVPLKANTDAAIAKAAGGYHVFVAMTHQYIFDYHDGDIFWCTADVGWVTGHSYIVYGPLANGATT